MQDKRPLNLVEVALITGRGYPCAVQIMKDAATVKTGSIAPGSPRKLFTVEEVARVICKLGWYSAFTRLGQYLEHRLPNGEAA